MQTRRLLSRPLPAPRSARLSAASTPSRRLFSLMRMSSLLPGPSSSRHFSRPLPSLLCPTLSSLALISHHTSDDITVFGICVQKHQRPWLRHRRPLPEPLRFPGLLSFSVNEKIQRVIPMGPSCHNSLKLTDSEYKLCVGKGHRENLSPLLAMLAPGRKGTEHS